MLDDRKAMDRGLQLVFDKEHRYTVLEELGRGASCLVYSAFYEDLAGCRHLVRMKECCPYNMGMCRQEDGGLQILPGFEQLFANAKEKFRRAYEKNVAIKGMLGLMNSTVDAVNLYEYHNTLYVVNACVEGRDYREELDETLCSVLIRMLTLAKIIKKYHDYGVLHLDIKPENMLIIPETKEHMVLFDFDSLLSKRELEESAAVRISFSDGYAAPELVCWDQKKIGEATDIYAIGAVVFYKLFGRTPDALDGAVSASYDFSRMHYQDERFQPELFRELGHFLHHSIASSVTYRYHSVDALMKQLKILIDLSDMERPFLYHQFSYHSACFAGRIQEMEHISRVFASGQQVLFLSGIGGIGKTELAKRYAYEHAQQYRSIVFLPFAGSIRQTVCAEALRIHQMEQEKEESAEAYFTRKLKLLKMVTTSRDLIILDNFDVEEDEDLERLFACPCRFLVTTREDFRDYNYEQLHVGRMEEMKELLQLFWNYYEQEDHREEAQMCRIIETVERHTMTVELIAKYLRTAGGSAQSLLDSLSKKEGITVLCRAEKSDTGAQKGMGAV